MEENGKKQPDQPVSDPELQGFEDVDFSTAPEEAAPEFTAESLGVVGGESDFKALLAAQAELEDRLLVAPEHAMAATADSGVYGLGNIVGIGIGEKEVDGYPTGQLAVKVFVKEKLSASDVASEALVPNTLGGVPTDVDCVGEVRSQMFTARLRPAPGGVSIGNCRMVMAGTLGCLVSRGNQLFILSNNHVLALVNTSPLGTPIPQPGRIDGGVCPADVIARLAAFIPINFAAGVCNFVDAAIAQTSPNLVDRRILRPGGIRQRLAAPIVAPVLNMFVHKSGRTTQYRRGLIDAVNVTVNVSYAPLGGVARFCRQFRVKGTAGAFSDAGDSGSLVTRVDGNNPVGLLFAGNAQQNQTFCNPIGPVLAAFGVNIVF
jgi:hypothetical protein